MVIGFGIVEVCRVCRDSSKRDRFHARANPRYDAPVLSRRTLRDLSDVAERQRGIDLLVLHGSRARGDAAAVSDWDFAFSGRPGVDVGGLTADLSRVLATDRIDVADLGRASALLRYRAARDAVVVFERFPDAFSRFWLDAVGFWCDAGAILQRGYDETLDRLDR
jgi:predicted nucleotidyltransferase